MLLASDGQPFRITSALLWSCTWALGAALGVALGGWLTLVGGEGAPGATALDPISDLVVLPGAAFLLVLAVELLVRTIAAALRGARPRGEQ